MVWTLLCEHNKVGVVVREGDEIKTTEGSMEIQTRCWKKIATPKKQKMEFNLDNKKTNWWGSLQEKNWQNSSPLFYTLIKT